MKIRKIEKLDSQKYLDMLLQLDNESDKMMIEPGERHSSIEEQEGYIDFIESSNSLVLIIEDGNSIVGYISIERGWANQIKHTGFLVVGLLEKYRGQGLGMKLFEEALKWCKDNDIHRIELYVRSDNDNAISLYKKMGFAIEGTKVDQLKVKNRYFDELIMAKIL
ncbi:MAG TPA: GNAT family N-acetyltransferase [Lachnospiraceae bacterium]|nr:GNAT family N-acetyltransferase [Lachnospiraceae bacterium]